MLKTASIFKDFRISVNADNTAVTFYKVSPLSVSVKNDNFATQVQILDNADTTDLFNYKYITFDDSAVFEITDCIKNEKYTTLFIQYLSNITFETENNNFYVDSVSANKLQDLGLNLNDFLQILGNNLTFKYSDVCYYSDYTGATQKTVYYAIKLRFSTMPANLNYKLTGTNNEVASVASGEMTGNGAYIYNQSINDIDKYPLIDNHFNSFDNAVVMYIILPTRKNMTFYFGAGESNTVYTSLDVVKTLSEIITDLTLSVELVLIDDHSIGIIDYVDIRYMDFDSFANYNAIRISNLTYMTDVFNFLRVPSKYVNDGTFSLCAPIFIIDNLMNTASTREGFAEILNFVKFNIPSTPENTKRVYTSLFILNNAIDISKLQNSYFYIKRFSGFMRIYFNIEKNLYTDIQTSIEFAKNAFSNFEAYQKANIELVNRQGTATLQQQQQQARELQTLNTVTKSANTLISSIASFASGDIGSGITNLLGGGVNIASEEIKYNMQTQNDKANLKLQQQQALERAQSIITPANEFSGSVPLHIAFLTQPQATKITIGGVYYFSLGYLDLNDVQLQILRRYIFDNKILKKATDTTALSAPEWTNGIYQVRINNRSAINTRKDLIIFVEDTAEE